MDDLSLYKGKKVLVTGGLGFIGSNLCHRLAGLGAEIVILDCKLLDHGANEANLRGIEQMVATKILDICDPSASAETRDAEYVFHIAGQTSHLDSVKDPQLDWSINAGGTLELLEGLKGSLKLKCFLYLGTRAQYGRVNGGRATETLALEPMDPYGVSKTAGEMYSLLYSKIHSLPSVSARLTNTYGPRHQMMTSKYGILNWFIRLALDGNPLTVYGDGSQKKDFIYIEDAVDALLYLALDESLRGEAFNVGSGSSVSFREMSKKIASRCNATLQTVDWPEDRKAIEAGDFVCDIEKISKASAWRPRVCLDDGLDRTVEYYQENKKYYW